MSERDGWRHLYRVSSDGKQVIPITKGDFDVISEVGMNRVEAYHDTRNPHSGAVMRKCGMQYEGTLRASAWNNQGVCDASWYAILSE